MASYIENLEMGYYPFEDYFLYDPVVHKDEDINETKIHEGIHYYLTQNSLCGTVICLLLQLSKARGDNIIPFKKVAEKLIKSSIKTQEACATFGECIYFKENSGLSSCKEKTDKLCKEYYKYVEILIPLMKYNSHEIMGLVFKAAVVALDIDFLILSKGFIKKPKKIGRFIEQNPNVFDPNRRFQLIIHDVIKKLNDGENLESISLDSICSSLGIPVNKDYNAPRKVVEWLKEELSSCVLPETIESFIVENSDNNGFMFWFDSGVPLAINKRFTKKRGIIPDEQTPGALIAFYFKSHFTVAWLDYINCINYTFNISETAIVRLCNRIRNPLIITVEDYIELTEFYYENINSNPLFIYNNNKYQMAHNFIETHISQGREVFIMEYNSKAYYLFVKLIGNNILIQPIESKYIPQVVRTYNYINGDKDENCSVFFHKKVSWIIYENIIYSLLQLKMYDKFDEVRPNFMILKES